MKCLRLERNNAILDISPLDGLHEKTEIHWFSNPGFRQGGPKIEGPWLWVYVSGVGFDAGVDLLSQASDGAVTELEIATNGAIEGEAVGEYVWTSGKISPVLLFSPVLSEAGHEGGHINFGTVVNAMGVERIYDKSMVYGSITLHAPREQQTTMFSGGWGAEKVWLNGEFLHEKPYGVWTNDYQDFFPVTLKQGANVLLVGLYDPNQLVNVVSLFNVVGFFGFAPEAEYTVVSPGTGFTFSTDTTSVRVGDTFTVRVNAEKVTDLAGWQFDLTFNPDVLEVVEVNEGDFLKTDGGDHLLPTRHN